MSAISKRILSVLMAYVVSYSVAIGGIFAFFLATGSRIDNVKFVLTFPLILSITPITVIKIFREHAIYLLIVIAACHVIYRFWPQDNKFLSYVAGWLCWMIYGFVCFVRAGSA
jgi:hypothetical protein